MYVCVFRLRACVTKPHDATYVLVHTYCDRNCAIATIIKGSRAVPCTVRAKGRATATQGRERETRRTKRTRDKARRYAKQCGGIYTYIYIYTTSSFILKIKMVARQIVFLQVCVCMRIAGYVCIYTTVCIYVYIVVLMLLNRVWRWRHTNTKNTEVWN